MAVSKPNKLIVADIGWAENIPDWLKREVEAERIGEGFADALGKGNGGKVGLAETAVYLFTLSLRQPLGYHYTQIYLWVSGKVMETSTARASNGQPELPAFIKEAIEKGLDSDEERQLDQLRQELYRKRGGAIRSPLFDLMKTLGKKIEKGAK